MSLAVYYQDDILDGIIGDLGLVMDTARHYNALNPDYLCGALSFAKAQAVSYGIPGRVLADRLRGELSQDNLGLLEAIL